MKIFLAFFIAMSIFNIILLIELGIDTTPAHTARFALGLFTLILSIYLGLDNEERN